MLLESHGPVKRFDAVLAPCISVQIMYKIAAPYDENPFIAQRCELLPDLVMKCGRLGFVNAQLHDGNIGLRENVTKYGPGSVVETPSLVSVNRDWRKQARTRLARSGLPGAGYLTSWSSRGKPPKSWIVRGEGIAVTNVAGRYQ